ncbi:hypothetical protein ACW9HR_12880 [Nocardia gipuzkoensis]
MQFEPSGFAVLVHGGPVVVRHHRDELAAAAALGVPVRHAGALRDDSALVGNRETDLAGVVGIRCRDDDRDLAFGPPQRIGHRLRDQQVRDFDLVVAEGKRPHESPGVANGGDSLAFVADRADRFPGPAHQELFAG